jgi:hypothetical protein
MRARLPLGPGIPTAPGRDDREEMERAVALHLRRVAALEDRDPARARLAAVLGEELAWLLVFALQPSPGRQRRHGDRPGLSSPYNRT